MVRANDDKADSRLYTQTARQTQVIKTFQLCWKMLKRDMLDSGFYVTMYARYFVACDIYTGQRNTPNKN